MDALPEVEADVDGQNPAQLARMQVDDVVQALPAQSSDESLGVWIPPRAARRREYLFDVQSAHSPREGGAMVAVAIADHASGGGIEGERFDPMLSSPLSRWKRSDVEMDDPAPRVGTGFHFRTRGYRGTTVGLEEPVIREYIRNQEVEAKRQEILQGL